MTDDRCGSDIPAAPLPPYRRWRHPPGCPDSDWCSGNDACFWRCQGDPDEGIEDAAPWQKRFARDMAATAAHAPDHPLSERQTA
jgi:hypothetical protein